jgi:SET domain-containing protein
VSEASALASRLRVPFGACELSVMPSSSLSPQPAPPLNSSHPLIRADESSIHGRGVYARVAIPQGTKIIEYTGERITKAESKRREEERLERQRQGGDGSVYIFELNKRYDLDGRTEGNVARLINHSCKPNCRSEDIRGHIWIIAQRDLLPGEELTFDYGYGYNEWRLHPCRCGAKECVGFIVNANQRWRVRRILRAVAARERAEKRRTARGQGVAAMSA